MNPTRLAAILWLGTVTLAAQAPTFYRGTGELLPPKLQPEPSPLTGLADLTMPEYLWVFQRETLLPFAAPNALPVAQRAAIARALLVASRDADEELRWQSLWALARMARTDAAVGKQLRARIVDAGAPGGAVLEQVGAVGDVGCLAIGLAAGDDQDVLRRLMAIGHDGQAKERRRAYAFYGLGLAAQESAAAAVQFRVLAAVERVLLAESRAPDEVRIAALHALALVRVAAAPDLPGPVDQLLARVWGDDAEPEHRELDFRAHVPLAVAAVCEPASERAQVWCKRFAEAAEARGRGVAVPRSCVLALGRLAGPWRDRLSPGAAIGELLQRLATSARDRQLRNYALFAMGVAGGERNVATLEASLRGNFLVRPWAAFGLAATARAGDADERQRAIAAAIERTRHITIRAAMQGALAIAEHAGRPRAASVADSYQLRYAAPLPEADANVVARLVADGRQSVGARCAAAAVLGHLVDSGKGHWSARLAAAIDYRGATPALLAFAHGVLRLP